jgi:hypothetical protein
MQWNISVAASIPLQPYTRCDMWWLWASLDAHKSNLNQKAGSCGDHMHITCKGPECAMSWPTVCCIVNQSCHFLQNLFVQLCSSPKWRFSHFWRASISDSSGMCKPVTTPHSYPYGQLWLHTYSYLLLFMTCIYSRPRPTRNPSNPPSSHTITMICLRLFNTYPHLLSASVWTSVLSV